MYPSASELLPSSIKSFGEGVAVARKRKRVFFMNATIESRVAPLKFFRIDDSSSITQTKSSADSR